MSLITRTFMVPVLAWTCMSFPAQATAATTDERLNKYLEVTSQHAKGEWQTNLGPTGAMGWIYLNRFYIESVEAGSPADGLLKKGDYILGVNGSTFPVVDPRVMFGKEINKAEAADGTLVFQVGYRGVERKVTVKIKPIGGRSPTWPFDCKKSLIIRDQALRWLRERQPTNGIIGGSVYSSINGLFLLSSPAPEDQDAARRCAYGLIDQDHGDSGGLSAWPYGYGALFLSEYYLATGDVAVLPRLQFYAKEIGAGIANSGSWTHGMSPGGVPGGYGELNIMGVVCFLSLVLMDECGVAVDPKPLASATHFFGRFAGLGTIPYGNNPPWDRSPSSANKDAVAAIAFRLLGDAEKSRAFADDTELSYQLTEDAHTGAFFSATWGPLGAILTKNQTGLRRLLDEQSWYFDLERRWDGGIKYLPNPENLTGITGFSGQPTEVTGGLCLTYSLPLKSLCILGGDLGPFSKKAGADLKPALALYREKKWDAFDSLTKSWSKEAIGSTPLGKQLLSKRAALQSQMDWTLATVDKTKSQTGLTRAESDRSKAMLKAIERLAGNDIEKVKSLRAGLDAVKELPLAAIVTGVARDSEHRERRTWKALLPLANDIKKEDPPKTWRVHAWTGDISPYLDNLEPAGEAMKGWYMPEFSATKWSEKKAPFRAHDSHPDAPFAGFEVSLVSHNTCMFQPRPLYNTYARLDFTVADAATISAARIVQQNCHQYLRSEVYLNGYRVAAILRPNTCELSPEAVKLIKQGKNTLALYLASCRGHHTEFDFGIEVVRK